jgi:hypothetical protein
MTIACVVGVAEADGSGVPSGVSVGVAVGDAVEVGSAVSSGTSAPITTSFTDPERIVNTAVLPTLR